MAALSTANPTYIDLIKSMDPAGNLMSVAEILNATNEGLDEMTWQEGNQTTGHTHRVRTGLPSVTWGQLYKGVVATKGNSVQVTDTTGFIESLSEVDARLVNLSSDPMGYRMQEDRPHVEAMSQEFMRVLFKGTAADADKYIGLEARYNSLSTATAATAQNVLNGAAGEDTDLTSIWLIGWSPRTIFGIIPKNSKAGLQQEDAGLQWIDDGITTGARMRVWRTYWRWDCGLAVADWRYAVRIANIDIGELTVDAATGPNLPNLMAEAMEHLPPDAFGTTRPAFYMNRQVRMRLRQQMENRIKSSTLTLDDVGPAGALSVKKKLHFDGVPINRCDVLTTDETAVA